MNKGLLFKVKGLVFGIEILQLCSMVNLKMLNT